MISSRAVFSAAARTGTGSVAASSSGAMHSGSGRRQALVIAVRNGVWGKLGGAKAAKAELIDMNQP
jgi:hypothetical protein